MMSARNWLASLECRRHLNTSVRRVAPGPFGWQSFRGSTANLLIVAAMCAVLFLVGLGSTDALAHANLTRATIHNNQVFRAGHVPRVIDAFFAEGLNPNPRDTWMAVFEGQGDHGLVTERQISKVNFRNPQEMVLTLPALRRERYYLIWHTRSIVDGHVAAGILYFRVR